MQLEQLQIDYVYRNKLDMRCFERMLESPTQSYKFYWLEAILTLLPDKDEMTFNEVVYEMLWEAWHTVTQYHLHLGPTINGKSENYIEHAIHVIEQDPDIQLSMLRSQFMNLAEKNKEKIKNDINGLIKNVPYRLLSSFMNDVGGNDRLWDQKKRLITYLKKLNENIYLPYIIIDGKGAEKRIRINPVWKQVMLDNYPVIKSWIQMKKIRFLQDRNPGVPGIIYKIEAENNNQRKLDKVKALWNSYEMVSGKELIDLYSGEPIKKGQLSIDHFIPWSYVTNDEIWNLVPMDRSNNSKKGNRLPEWKRFFPQLVLAQFNLYEMIFSNDILRKNFESCKTHNLNALWANEYLYIPGKSKEEFEYIMEQNVKPIYQSAIIQGYSEWRI